MRSFQEAMSTADFMSRVVGLFVFSILGARFGADASSTVALPAEASSLLFALVGALIGLTLTPYLTVRPLAAVSRSIRDMPIETFVMALIGAVVGLVLALLISYPMSLLPPPLSQWVPPAVAVVGAYLGVTIFRVRARELWEAFAANRVGRSISVPSSRKLLVDTSVLIDGRIVDVAKTGFLGGTLLIPQFVMRELQQVADSSDTLRRGRGRHGLDRVKALMRNEITPVQVIDDDIETLVEVDDKLVALSIQLEAFLLTNDYPLAKIAEAQGVTVLNINLLSNAVRVPYIPGESFPLHIIQEGTDEGQGVGYLEDGTMVVVENGKRHMDRTIRVEVTKLINREAGRMIFAVPAK